MVLNLDNYNKALEYDLRNGYDKKYIGVSINTKFQCLQIDNY
jgi:hypothetical protein